MAKKFVILILKVMFVVLILFLLTKLVETQDVVSCGGFIKSAAPINYANIMVSKVVFIFSFTLLISFNNVLY